MENREFALNWIAYAMSWDRVLAEWNEAENFAVLRACGLPYLCPLGGLVQAIEWSRARGEMAQHELIGMTAEAKVGVSYLASYGAATNSKADVNSKPARVPRATFETQDT